MRRMVAARCTISVLFGERQAVFGQAGTSKNDPDGSAKAANLGNPGRAGRRRRPRIGRRPRAGRVRRGEQSKERLDIGDCFRLG